MNLNPDMENYPYFLVARLPFSTILPINLLNYPLLSQRELLISEQKRVWREKRKVVPLSPLLYFSPFPQAKEGFVYLLVWIQPWTQPFFCCLQHEFTIMLLFLCAFTWVLPKTLMFAPF